MRSIEDPPWGDATETVEQDEQAAAVGQQQMRPDTVVVNGCLEDLP
jgi:hypothetical protein